MNSNQLNAFPFYSLANLLLPTTKFSFIFPQLPGTLLPFPLGGPLLFTQALISCGPIF